MKMDGNSSDQSPPLSENNGGSWVHCWENEDSSLSGLNLDINSHEIQDLVEDKEIAARAVAFVVSSTRKGIVPLCADVASLLRGKKVLEQKISRLKRENDVLRSSRSTSIRTSQSTSPPPSINSYSDRASLPEHSSHLHDRPSRPCSRCSSHCSSLVSNSPKLDKVHPHNPRSPRIHRTSAFTPRNANQHMTVAMVHNTLNNVHPPPSDLLASSPQESSLLRPKAHLRKNSLPEIVSEPHGSVPKINPRVKNLSKEIQCEMVESMSDTRLQEQFRETLKINSSLAEELGAAKKEIQVLKGKLKELEMNQLARQCLDQFHQENGFQLENECRTKSLTGCISKYGGDHPLLLPVVHSAPSSGRSSPSANSPILQGIRKSSPIVMPGPMFGCKCKVCEVENQDPMASRVDASSPLTKTKNGITCNRDTWSHRMQIEVDDHVVVSGERTGYVRYIGHLDSLAHRTHRDSVFVGLELDAPVSSHDGSLDGKRYFFCPKDHGVFIPLQDILCIISKRNDRDSASSYTSEDERPSVASRPAESSRVKRQGSQSSLTSKKERVGCEKKYISEPRKVRLPRSIDQSEGHIV